MSDRMRGAGRRAFRPGMDLGGGAALESRDLLAIFHFGATVPVKPYIQSFTQFGGQIVKILDTQGNVFNVDMVGGGHVRAKPMSGGRVKLIVEGSSTTSQLSINLIHPRIIEGTAHTFKGTPQVNPILHIGDIKITSGTIGQILGYQTADLSGAVNIPSTADVSRIALYQIKPGASITTGGSINTFDVYNDLTISGGPGISVGRDINWMYIRGNLTVGAGSTFSVGRDIGLSLQQPDGTDPGGQGALIVGDLIVQPGGAFTIGRTLDAPFVVDGQTTGANMITIPFGATNFFSRGGISA